MADIFLEHPELLDLDPDQMDALEQYNWAVCWTHVGEATIARVDAAAALILCRGDVSDMARVLKRTRSAVVNFLKRDVQLTLMRVEAQDVFLDKVEALYQNIALSGDGTALRFFLTTLGKDRGYVTRGEMTGKKGEPLNAPTTLSKEALAAMSPEVLAELLAARDKSVEDAASAEAQGL